MELVFKLPIEYQRTSAVAPSMVDDLELLDARGGGKSMYDVLLAPNTPMATFVAKRSSTVFTDDALYLKQTAQFIRKMPWTVAPKSASFATSWTELQTAADFNALYHFVEHPRLTWLNLYPTALFVLSLQSIMSPLLFLLSPIFILLIPFAILQVTNKGVSWETYRVALSEVLRRHALGALFYGPKTVGNLVSSGAAVGLFLVQLYTSVQCCWQFYRNLTRVHAYVEDTAAHVDYVLAMMDQVEEHAPSKYKRFVEDMAQRRVVLQEMKRMFAQVQPFRYNFKEVRQLGYVRNLFYRLRYDAEWGAAVDYSLGFTGYVETMASVRSLLLQKRIAACRFSKATPGVRFTAVHYPPHPDHERHQYALTSGKLITGPNASGKTTFVKAAMLGVLFSQQFGCGFYQKAQLKPFQELCCYLNIPDTSGRDSLFQAEARRCKEIVDLAQRNRRMFCIFDELFSGTNPYEASASAYGLLTHLTGKSNVSFLLTTHFLDLCERLNDNPKIENVHMKSSTRLDGSIAYEYTLQKGISRVKGGVQVLKDLNFPQSIVDCAKTY